MEPVVRKGELTDAEAIARLMHQWGYETSLREVVERMKRIEAMPQAVVLVAETGPAVVGWLYVTEHVSLGSGPFAEVCGMVVDEDFRKQGIGTKLLEAAGRWAKDNGLSRVLIRTNIKREEANQFYPKAGFELIKTQHVYERKL